MMWECVWAEQLDVMMEIPRDCKRERKKGVEMEEWREVWLGTQRAV